MIFREATVDDITQLQVVRNSVKENVLSEPALVPDKDYEPYLKARGKGWVCEIDGTIIGFAIVDLVDHNIWALFLHPGFEKKGIGKQLHNIMLDWYFNQTQQSVWLGTAPGTRAELFYKHMGWTVIGTHGKGEVKFEMTYANWIMHK
ncbi:MAG: GNAT family N-acetyltransferase [Bacteroidota bacterium]